jgi:hypothetical protein
MVAGYVRQMDSRWHRMHLKLKQTKAVLCYCVSQLLEGNKYLLQALGSGLWPVMVLLSEIVQTFILAGFW